MKSILKVGDPVVVSVSGLKNLEKSYGKVKELFSTKKSKHLEGFILVAFNTRADAFRHTGMAFKEAWIPKEYLKIIK